MRKPCFQKINIPDEVIRCANDMEEEPRLYYGSRLQYAFILWPERMDNILALRIYETEDIRDCYFQGEEVPEPRGHVVYIDVARKRWWTCKFDNNMEKWGKATIEYLLGWRSNRHLLLHPEVVKDVTGWGTVDEIMRWQKGINHEKLFERQKKKDAKNINLMEQAKELPADYLEWHEHVVMKESRYLIYKRTNRRQFEAFCTHCENHVMISSKACRHNEKGKCPECGSRVIMKSSGRIKGLIDTVWSEYVQAVDNGLMLRFIKMQKNYSEYGHPKRLVWEPARVVIERGKAAVWYEDRCSNTWYSSASQFQKNNREGCVFMAHYPHEHSFGQVYTKGIKQELTKAFPYHMFWEFQQQQKRKKLSQYDIYDYFDTYSQYPLIESLQKTKKHALVEYFCAGKRSRHEELDKKARQAHKMLGITRQQYKLLKNPKWLDIELMRFLGEKGIVIDKQKHEKLEKLLRVYEWKHDLDIVLSHMSVDKILRYAEQGTVTVNNISMYADYLSMAERLGWDMNSTRVLFPEDIRRAHDEAVRCVNEEEWEKKRKEAKKHDKSIAAVERKIRKKFSFKDDQFILRPARTNSEIVVEGQVQHICVGGGMYRDKMEKGKSYILFLRKKEEPDIPFYTIEISPDYKIIQRHGKYNHEGDEVKEVDEFLNKFVEVRKREKHHAS